MRIPSFLTLALAPALLAAAPASAQYVVLGESHASACFQNAIAGREDSHALEDCDVAIEHETLNRRDRAATFVNRAIIRMRNNRLDGAERDLERAEGIRETFAPVIAVNRSALFVRMHRFNEAIAAADLAIELDAPDIAHAYFNRGVAFEAQGDIRSAYNSYAAALEARPGWRMAERELARFTVTPGS